MTPASLDTALLNTGPLDTGPLDTGPFDMGPLDMARVRAEFPGLAADMAFFDNAGGSQALGRVVERIGDFLLHSNAQLGASYATSVLAGARVRESNARAAELIGAARPEEVVMGGSATALLRTLVEGLRERFAPGDEVIVTNLDHEANIGAWLSLAGQGVHVRWWEVNRDTLRLEPDDLRALLSPRTRMVALTYASNILGSINPVPEIVRVAHEAGAMVCVDGVAYAPHRAVDVQALGVDFYVFSFYKVFGPHYALLYGKYEHLLRMRNLNHCFIADDDIPYKLQPGNQNYELGYGAIGIGDYLSDLGGGSGGGGADEGGRQARIAAAFGRIAAHEAGLAGRLLGYLRGRNDVTVVGEGGADPAARVATVSFTAHGRASRAVVEAVDRHRIGIRFGDFYAKRLIRALGLEAQGGVVRVSMVHYNTTEEVDRLIAALDEALRD